jgi:hypothetical protein
MQFVSSRTGTNNSRFAILKCCVIYIKLLFRLDWNSAKNLWDKTDQGCGLVCSAVLIEVRMRIMTSQNFPQPRVNILKHAVYN